MYVITRERLGLIPPRFSFVVLPPAIQAFLDRVGKNPKSFEPLLLTVELHPDPFSLDLGPGGMLHTDLILLYSTPATSAAVGKTVLGLLKAILNQYKQDPRFQRQVEAEYNLASQLQQATGKLPRQKLEPFLFNAWLEPDINLTAVGRDFAAKMLPTLLQAIEQSKVPNTHVFNLGRSLQKRFEALLKEPDFRQRYETELENRTMAVTKEFLRKSPVTAKRFLIEAALSSEASQGQVGKSFAAKILPGFTPSRLYDRVLNSNVAEGIFMRLGIYLKVAADVERTTDRFRRSCQAGNETQAGETETKAVAGVYLRNVKGGRHKRGQIEFVE